MDDQPSIKLDTPPPSPVSWIDLSQPSESHTDLSSYLQKLPVKRARKGHKRSKNQRRRIDAAPDHPTQETNDSLGVVEDASLLLHENTNQASHDTEKHNSVENTDSKYGKYLDTVLTDNAPFYQISRDLFVVSGWDAKKECNNVSWSNQ
jgi:hypothetical protein